MKGSNLRMDGYETGKDLQDVGQIQLVAGFRSSVPALGDSFKLLDGRKSSPGGSDAKASAFLPLLGLYVGLRAVLFLGNVLVARMTMAPSWLVPFTAWDGHWYTQVAQTWYGSSELGTGQLTYSAGGFGPGWPALIRIGTLLGLSLSGSAFLMSLVVGAITVYAIWRLSCEVVPQNSLAATTAVIVFPGAAVAFGLAYSEVLGIGCAAATLFFFMRRRWVLAGIAGAVATATSPIAVVLPVACLVEAILLIRQRREYKSLLPVFIAPLGFIGFVAYLGYLANDPFYWWKLQAQAWGAKIEPGYIFHWLWGLEGSGWGMYWLAALGLMILVYLVVTAVRSELPVSAKVYCVAVALMALANPAIGPKPRFLFWMFPSLMLLPVNLKPKVFSTVVTVMAMLLPLLLIAYTTIGNTVAQP